MSGTLKNITSKRLFLPIFCLALVLLINVITTPDFFQISVRDGVLYGYIIDIINRASELVDTGNRNDPRLSPPPPERDISRGRDHGCECSSLLQPADRRRESRY